MSDEPKPTPEPEGGTLGVRLRGLGGSALVAVVFCGASFPLTVMRDGNVEEWSEWALGPSLLVMIAAGVGGWVKPRFFGWRNTFALSALAIALLASRGYRDTHPPSAPPNPALERLLRSTQTPRVIRPGDAGAD
jgi:hypothetical protein